MYSLPSRLSCLQSLNTLFRESGATEFLFHFALIIRLNFEALCLSLLFGIVSPLPFDLKPRSAS